MRQKADAQRIEFDNLLRDKERLVRKLAMLEQEKSLLMADADDYTQLQQQVMIVLYNSCSSVTAYSVLVRVWHF